MEKMTRKKAIVKKPPPLEAAQEIAKQLKRIANALQAIRQSVELCEGELVNYVQRDY